MIEYLSSSPVVYNPDYFDISQKALVLKPTE